MPFVRSIILGKREHVMADKSDPYELDRFIQAQTQDFEIALTEIYSARQRSHWMWYIFPQFAGLGFSAISQCYAIRSAAEARAYLNHHILGARLIQCIEALLAIDGRSAHEIFGSPDDMKLKSCATLFASVTPKGSAFECLLEKYFQGERDQQTLSLMDAANDC
ncbi:uncharacterized protein (DUF1810 family) [Nitrosomonas oligotropha]|uniref:Uncharacterized protein (DUF1810 family) n=2 Tax=Nitrosomonas oligotropha TaxID=42354 RepID=A0A2T5HXT8_9PROT|nr:uncharacterized protein (DUF1810 family) [Nitrosomonas oligotropha]